MKTFDYFSYKWKMYFVASKNNKELILDTIAL